jgi:NADH-quinone oxidoreductase subunit L
MMAWEEAEIGRNRLFRALHNKWYFDEIYDGTVIRATLALRMALDWFDTCVVDGLVNGVAYITRAISFLEGLFDSLVVDGAVNLVGDIIIWAGARLRRIQTGRLQTYVVLVLAGILVIMAIRII